MAVYTKEKVAKCRTPVLDLLVKVGVSWRLCIFFNISPVCLVSNMSCVQTKRRDQLLTKSLIHAILWESVWYIWEYGLTKQLFVSAGYTSFLSNTLHRFSKLQRLPVWLQTFESVKYLTDFTASFVRRANYQILVSLPLMPETLRFGLTS